MHAVGPTLIALNAQIHTHPGDKNLKEYVKTTMVDSFFFFICFAGIDLGARKLRN